MLWSAIGGALLRLVRHLAMDVGPEFLDGDRNRVERELRPPDAGCVPQSSIGRDKQVWVRRRAQERAVRVIGEGRNCRRRSATENLRGVELGMPGIPSSHNNSTDRIAGPVQEAARTGLEKTGILVERRGEDRSDHEVFNRAVCGGRPITFSVGRPALSVTRFAIFGLRDRSEQSPPGKLHRIERAASHHRKLLLCGERRNVRAVLKRQEIRQRVEKSVFRSPGLLGICLTLGVLATLGFI